MEWNPVCEKDVAEASRRSGDQFYEFCTRELLSFLYSLSFFGPMVSYLIIYLKNTKHNEIQEKARRIQAGMCTEPKLTSN
jgi:hypothetical protein